MTQDTEDAIQTDARTWRVRLFDAVTRALWFLPPVRRLWALQTGSVCSLIPGRKGRNCLGAGCYDHMYRWSDDHDA